MSYLLSLGIALSLGLAAAPDEPDSVEVRSAQPSSIRVPASTILAQRGGRGRDDHSGGPSSGQSGHSGGSSGGISILGGGSSGHSGSYSSGGNHPPSINIHPPSSGGYHPPSINIGPHSDYPNGHSHGTVIIRPPYNPYHPPYYPPYYPPDYVPPTYPVPGTVPSNTVPSNAVPTEPVQPVEPETNVVLVDPEPNDFLDDLGFRPITVKELQAFKDQITKKNQDLGKELEKLFPGNEQAIDALVDLANKGQLDAKSLQDFVKAFGGGLNVQQQLQATGLLKQLAFNNLALKALINVNINNLNININAINLVNININMNVFGGGWIGGFWGFPWWPWNYPIWLGPGVWWGPCVYCPYPYYNPNLTGADALGVPYSIAAPVPDYQGAPVTSGILLTNAGGSAVNYTLDGQRFSMQPDYRQTVARTSVVVAFDRGGSFGQARYRIDEGWYKFTATDRGWELYKHTAKAALSNVDNPFEFKYVLDNQRQTLPAGSQQELTGKYPIVLRFDNGKGQTKEKMLEKGIFKVALSGEGTLDLFRPEDVTLPAPIAEMAKQQEEQTKNIFAEPEQIPNLFGPTTAAQTPGPQPTTSPASPPPPTLFGNP